MEKKSLKNLDSKKANAGYGNYTKYSRDAAPYYQGEPWCAIFVSWCMKEAYGLNKAQKLLKDWPYIAWQIPARISAFLYGTSKGRYCDFS